MALSEEEAVTKIGEHGMLLVRGMFIQMVMDSFMTGLYTRQLWTYYENMKGDSKWLKALVVWIAIVSYSNTAFIMWWTAKLFIHNYGLYAAFLDASTLSWFPLLDGVLSGCVQLFFSYRVYRMNGSKSMLLMLISAGLVLASMVSAITTKVMWTMTPSLLTKDGIWAPMLVWLLGIMAANFIITPGILLPLVRARAYKDSHVVIRIFHLAMESQVICTLMSIAYLLQYIAIPSAFVGATFLGIQAKFYSAGMMYTINSRLVLPGTTDGQFVDRSHSNIGQIGGLNGKGNAGHLSIGMTYLSGQVRRSLQGRDGTEPLSAMDASTVTDMKYAPSSDVKDVSSSDTDTKSGDESEAKVVTASKSKIDQFFGAEPSSESRDLDQTVTAVTKYVE